MLRALPWGILPFPKARLSGRPGLQQQTSPEVVMLPTASPLTSFSPFLPALFRQPYYNPNLKMSLNHAPLCVLAFHNKYSG